MWYNNVVEPDEDTDFTQNGYAALRMTYQMLSDDHYRHIQEHMYQHKRCGVEINESTLRRSSCNRLELNAGQNEGNRNCVPRGTCYS